MAAELAASAAANAVGHLATEYASPYVNYFFRFGRIVEEFKNQRKELEFKIGRIKNDVDEAIRQTEVIEKDVEDWLAMADKELEQAQGLEDELERNKCFNWCPSWGWQYCLSKKVAKKTLCMKKLVETRDFTRVGHRPPLKGIEFLPSKDFKASQSSTAAFNAIIKALTTDGVNMIGLYGMPGVGKTTLAKKVGKYVGEKKLFDKVVMVTMSQTPNISKIQDRIADMFDFKFDKSSEEGRAEELLRRLKDEKIFIIIDDVWKEFELKTIGILCGENEDCKILLTTRVQPVCIQMNCQEKFELEILAKDEAWALFKDNAGLEDLSPTATKLIEVAKELACECQVLPLAIITVAKALKGQNLNAWEAANKRLKDSRHLDNLRVVGNIYSCLELSYDYLIGDNTKSCFLLCSLFPEDYDIPIDELTLLGIGEGLFCNIESTEEQRREIRLALIDIQQSGLLLEINKVTVRMHDVVRDFAHWLTLTGDTKFMVKDKLMKWPMNENFESHSAIAIRNVNMTFFPDKLEFKKLKTLILSGNRLTVPTTFFEGMKALRILWLKGVEFSLEVLQFLTNLRALLLENCKLITKNNSSLINMEKLEILFVSGFYMDALSEELGGLQYLKYLYWGEDIKFPPNLLLRLTSLQELHLSGRNRINLRELSSLSCLTALSLHVSSACLSDGFVFPKVQSYSIGVNKDSKYMRGQICRILELESFSSSLIPFNQLFCNVEKLILRHTARNTYIFSNGGLNELTSLELSYCNDLEYLIEPTHNHANSNTSLQSLQVAKIEWCRNLKSIFSPCIAHNPLHLQQLTISVCYELEQVFVFSEDDVHMIEQHQENQLFVLSNLTYLELSLLPKLRHIWTGSTYLVNLSSLNTMNIEFCNKLECLFSPSLAQTLVHLEHISIKYCKDLEHLISMEAENGDAFCWPKLTSLKLQDCNNLKDVFSISLPQGLPALKNVEIDSCHQLKQVFGFAEDLHFVKQDQPQVLINLINLKLKCLSELRSIWEGPTHLVNLSSLRTSKISDCEKLKCIFSFSFARTLVHLEIIEITSCMNLQNVFPITLTHGLPGLKNIEIDECPRLKQVFGFAEDLRFVEPHQENKVLSSLAYLKLRFLDELRCIWGGSTHLLNLSSLNNIKIEHCKNLECLFSPSLAQTLLHLEQISIHSCQSLEHLISTEPRKEDAFCWPKLNTLNIKQCKNLKDVFSITLAQGLPALENIEIVDCPQLGMLVRDIDDQALLLPNLSNLELRSIPKLEFQWNGTNHNDGFQNLKVVKISKCNGLKYVFSASFTQCLAQLQQLHIDDCNELEYIISESQSDGEIGSHSGHDLRPFLPHLQDLYLKNLMNLSGLSSQNSPISFSFLKKLTVRECPRLANFSIKKNVNEQVQMKELNVSYSGYDMINSQLKQNSRNPRDATMLEIFKLQDEQLLSRIETIEMWCMNQLEGPIQVASLQYLRKLKLSKCNGLKSLFSPLLARNLPQLTLLEIECCMELEEIIDTTSASSSSSSSSTQGEAHLPQISFPNLESLHIIACENLKSLFPVCVIPSLSKINTIKIVGASKLEQVFTYRAELDINQDDQNDKRIMLSSLEIFELVLLSGLKSLAPMGYHFLFPSSCDLEIGGCPKLCTSFSRDSKKVVHAITQAQPFQHHQNETIRDFTLFNCISSRTVLPLYAEEEESEGVDG